MNSIINKIITNPKFIPPENFMELDLTNLKTILKSCSKEVCVKFAIGEAELVLLTFVSAYPGDDRPRKAIESGKRWLKDPTSTTHAAANAAARAADAAYAAAARAAAYAAYAAARAANAAARAADAAYAAAYAADACGAISPEDQLERLFIIMRTYDGE